MKRLRHRVIEPEILDTLPPERARASLDDLVRLNRFFGGHSALGHALAGAGLRRSDVFSLLDVGAASGDMGRKVREWHPAARVVSLDLIDTHLERADRPAVTGDGFRLPFGDGTFDYAFSSLFLHHFTDEEIGRLLGEMRRVSRRGVLAVDLRRHPVPYYFVPATRWLFGWDKVTANDAPVSVAAGFRPEELAELARRAGLRDPVVRSHGLSFRLTLVARV